MRRLSFIPQLDSFRFIAVILVMISHWLPRYHAIPTGFLGVTFFFVLSGYLITGNLLYLKQSTDNQEISVPNAFKLFYFRRTLRIFPLYYLVILLVFLLNSHIFEGQVIWYLTYLPNFLLVKTLAWPGMLSHFWSLGVEEQFYLIWPCLIFFVPWNWLKYLFPAIIAIAVGSDMIVYFTHAPWFWYFLPWNNFDAFGVGALLAYIPFSRRQRFLTDRIPFAWGFLISAAAITLVCIFHIQYLFGLSVSGAAFFLIRKAKTGFTGITGRILDLPLMQYMGKISYGLYVYHNFMPWLWRCLTGKETRYPISLPPILRQEWFSKPLVALTGQLLLLVVIASLSWYLFEKPLVNLKNRVNFKPQPSIAN